MEYVQIKQTINETLAEYVKQGNDPDEAEERLMKAALKAFGDDKIGFMDLKYFGQILGFGFAGKMAEQMDNLKQAIRAGRGIDDYIDDIIASGKTKEEAISILAEELRSTFENEKDTPIEWVDMFLWSLGYKLDERFLLNPKLALKERLTFELDD